MYKQENTNRPISPSSVCKSNALFSSIVSVSSPFLSRALNSRTAMSGPSRQPACIPDVLSEVDFPPIGCGDLNEKKISNRRRWRNKRSKNSNLRMQELLKQKQNNSEEQIQPQSFHYPSAQSELQAPDELSGHDMAIAQPQIAVEIVQPKNPKTKNIEASVEEQLELMFTSDVADSDGSKSDDFVNLLKLSKKKQRRAKYIYSSDDDTPPTATNVRSCLRRKHVHTVVVPDSDGSDIVLQVSEEERDGNQSSVEMTHSKYFKTEPEILVVEPLKVPTKTALVVEPLQAPINMSLKKTCPKPVKLEKVTERVSEKEASVCLRDDDSDFAPSSKTSSKSKSITVKNCQSDATIVPLPSSQTTVSSLKGKINFNSENVTELINSGSIASIEVPPQQPKSGDVLFYCWPADSKKVNDWRADGYHPWKFRGSHRLPLSEPVYRVTQQTLYEDVDMKVMILKRKSWSLLKPRNGMHYNVVWYYAGNPDHTYKGIPHQNATGPKTTVPYRRTMPSVLSSVKEIVAKSGVEKAQDILTNLRLEGVPVRDRKQISNFTWAIRNTLDEDALANLLHMANSDPKMFPQLVLAPLCCPMLFTQTIDEFRSYFADERIPVRTVFIDTTFKRGDFLVTVVSTRAERFSERPLLILAVFVHDSKDERTHERLLRCLCEQIPELDDQSTAIGSDREPAIELAIDAVCPTARRFNCYIHIFRNIKERLRKLGCNSAERRSYRKDVLKLLFSETLTQYEDSLADLSTSWSLEFRSYFMKSLDKDIKIKAGKWVVGDLPDFDEENGISTNVAVIELGCFRRMFLQQISDRTV